MVLIPIQNLTQAKYIQYDSIVARLKIQIWGLPLRLKLLYCMDSTVQLFVGGHVTCNSGTTDDEIPECSGRSQFNEREPRLLPYIVREVTKVSVGY